MIGRKILRDFLHIRSKFDPIKSSERVSPSPLHLEDKTKLVLRF
jgi:hypothetical protein